MTRVHDHVDAITRRAALEAGLDPDSDARHELASHLYDLARDRAAGRPVTRADIDAAWAELEPHAIYLLRGEEAALQETPSVASPAGLPPGPKGAPWTIRFLAYLIDAASVFFAFVLTEEFVSEVLHPEDEIMDLLVVVLIVAAAVILVRLEMRRGGTQGKLLFQLHTIDAVGGHLTWPQALLITLPKFFPPLVVLDTLLGMVVRRKEKQRFTERWAKVRVVRRAR